MYVALYVYKKNGLVVQKWYINMIIKDLILIDNELLNSF